jgi:hypothetical protein
VLLGILIGGSTQGGGLSQLQYRFFERLNYFGAINYSAVTQACRSLRSAFVLGEENGRFVNETPIHEHFIGMASGGESFLIFVVAKPCP